MHFRSCLCVDVRRVIDIQLYNDVFAHCVIIITTSMHTAFSIRSDSVYVGTRQELCELRNFSTVHSDFKNKCRLLSLSKYWDVSTRSL